MLSCLKNTCAALSVSALLVGGVSTAMVLLAPDAALAKSENAGGKGQGRGKSDDAVLRAEDAKSRRGGPTSARRGNSDFAREFNRSLKELSQKFRAEDRDRGKLASELKGLNAAHANENALSNAAPNSQVGRVSAYVAALNGETPYDADLADAQQALSLLEGEYDGRSTLDVLADIDGLDADDPANADELAALGDELNAAQKYEATRDNLNSEIETLEASIESASDPEAALLEASNGRELSPEALDELHLLLGIEPSDE